MTVFDGFPGVEEFVAGASRYPVDSYVSAVAQVIGSIRMNADLGIVEGEEASLSNAAVCLTCWCTFFII
jgi:hypothetical protein